MKRSWSQVCYQGQLGLPDPGKMVQRVTLSLSVDITDDFDVSVNYYLIRLSDPVPREDGTVPMKDDNRLTVNLGVEF